MTPGLARASIVKVAQALAMLMLLLSGTAAGAAPAVIREALLQGRWQPDAERGEEPERIVRHALRTAERVLKDMAGPSIYNRPDERTTRARARNLMQLLRVPMQHVDIHADGVRLRFRYDDAEDSVVFTDGRTSTVDAQRRNVVYAAWEGETLYVERSSLQGTRVIEAWYRDGEALRVDYEVLNSLLEEPLEYSLYLLPMTTTETP